MKKCVDSKKSNSPKRQKATSAHGIVRLVSIGLLILSLYACNTDDRAIPDRPMDPWAFRSVLDRQPRMLTLALDSSCFAAYDLARCTLYKAWKGGVTLEGAVFTDKKNVQPEAWGKSYFSDSLHRFKWVTEVSGEPIFPEVRSRGYTFSKKNQITLRYALLLPGGDTIQVEEQPEFLESKQGEPGIERIFNTSGVPDGVKVSLRSSDSTFSLASNGTTRVVNHFKPLPLQSPPSPELEYDHRGRYWMEKSDCLTCHELDRRTVGPSFLEISNRYTNEKATFHYLIRKVKEGGAGVWGTTAMNAHPGLTEREIDEMLDYIFSLKPKEDTKGIASPNKIVAIPKSGRPGDGFPLEGIHPSYDVQTIHGRDFRPRVGGLAFLPDGRLLVTTWDVVGGVYVLDGVETGDTARITVKRIASGLAEPLGIEVVDGEIFVLQKHELTRLIDLDGDEVIDVYEPVCNQWGVTADFHEFAFGLVYKDGYFYVTLSMAMRLMGHEKQQPDRGRTLKISRNGSYEWINFGLRTPNGIGVGIDDEIFVTDNQGEWVPGNKLIHVKKGEYHGMRWGLPDTMPENTPVAAPAIWLPENEIGNSPSEPVLMRDGPYAGQMLHGDVTHGGIKRDFMEKVNGEYQGAVFRFTQGLEAGINRMRWGPDGALYVGGVGMVGGWSWKENKYGLQRMKYNGTTTFEMLAVRARSTGFEIELTEPVESGRVLRRDDFHIEQWWYLPTANYGGPKLDLQKLEVKNITLSADRTRVLLEIPGLKKEHVIYFRLAGDLRSVSDKSLWSTEAWYTLNNIPE